MAESMHRKRDGTSDNSSIRARRVSDKEKPTRHFSKQQENSVASAVNGKRQKNSGATMWDKGDVVSDNMLIECKTKTSSSQSISVKKEWVEKNKQEALFIGKPYSSIAFNFGPDEPNYYIIDEYLFQDLVEYLKLKEGD